MHGQTRVALGPSHTACTSSFRALSGLLPPRRTLASTSRGSSVWTQHRPIRNQGRPKLWVWAAAGFGRGRGRGFGGDGPCGTSRNVIGDNEGRGAAAEGLTQCSVLSALPSLRLSPPLPSIVLYPINQRVRCNHPSLPYQHTHIIPFSHTHTPALSPSTQQPRRPHLQQVPPTQSPLTRTHPPTLKTRSTRCSLPSPIHPSRQEGSVGSSTWTCSRMARPAVPAARVLICSSE